MNLQPEKLQNNFEEAEKESQLSIGQQSIDVKPVSLAPQPDQHKPLSFQPVSKYTRGLMEQ